MSDETATFPSITFPATFEGAAAIGGDFSATLKMKTSDGPKVLADLKNLPRGTYDVTIVSRQGALAGDSVDREWANLELQADEEAELTYETFCIGGACPHFAVHGAGDLAGSYVCELDPDALMVVVHGEARCPLYPDAEAIGNADDDGVDELPVDDEVSCSPGTMTVKELAEEFGALVIAAGDVDEMNEADAARYNALSDELTARGRNPQDWRRIAEDDAA
ncbi:MAG TPA: hypothetical protein VIJ45_06210 [Coriobacteriia bacterium]